MSQRRKKIEKNREVNAYWKETVLNDRSYWTEKLGYRTFETILDGNGERCYACGDKAPLHKCHILAHSLGGSTENNNLFLMCESCHRDNPDTIYSDLFFTYVREREDHIEKFFREFLYHFENNVNSNSSQKIRACDYIDNSGVDVDKLLQRIKTDSASYSYAAGKISTATMAGMAYKIMSE